MPDANQCPDCGAVILDNQPRGLCSRCALKGALDLGTQQVSSKASETMSAVEAEAGDRIGRYKVLEKIGEGGCGVVYMAEQEEPVRRRVALKVIKPGMDTREVIARFEAERQALALMEHPHIAKVFDGGATDAGRPYFVMELVRGLRITEYCDHKNLSTRQRLDLFMQVCQAVQHAHQKGVIHRDLKPSNILVTVNDGMAVPKVIDFGIAKATGQRLTDKTLFTKFQQLIGTPAYMSPEQAEMTSVDIDTRSDIYSLGVVLYELLTGRTPFDSKELLRAGMEAMLRTIREREPVRPSARLITLAASEQTTVAQQRQTDTPKLVNLLRGDLDSIVMKCLEKDRGRRYETANGLAADVHRHLTNEPILARPPNNLYRFQKMVRRNKLAFAAAGSIALVVLAAAVIATILFMNERIARKRATEAEIEMLAAALKAEQFATAFSRANSGDSDWRLSLGTSLASLRHVTAAWTRDRIQRELADRPALRADLLFYKGRRMKTVETSEIADLSGATTNLMDMMFGEIPERVEMLNEALRLREALYGADSPAAAEVHEELAEALVFDSISTDPSFEEGKLDKAENHAVAAVAIRKKANPGNREYAEALLTLSDVMSAQGKPAKAQAAIADAIAIQSKFLHPQAWEIGKSHAKLAHLQQQEGQMEAARDSLKIAVGCWDSNVSKIFALSTRVRLVSVLRKCGDLEEAEQVCLQTLSIARNGGKDTAAYVGFALRESALIRKDKHDLAGAVEAAREALTAVQQQGVGGTLYKRTLGCLLSDLALANTTNGATDAESITAIMKEAEDLLLTADPSPELLWPDNPKNETAKAFAQLKQVYKLSGRSNEVIRLQRRAVQSITESLNEAERFASGNQEFLKEIAEERVKLEAGKLKIP
jgi:serine/threonine protein kinase/tetratricopeptide (TPR) repeat protein